MSAPSDSGAMPSFFAVRADIRAIVLLRADRRQAGKFPPRQILQQRPPAG